MNSVFIYKPFALVDSAYSRKKQHVTSDPAENVPLSFTHYSADTPNNTLYGRNILYFSKHLALNGDETPPGPYDDDNDDDDSGSD